MEASIIISICSLLLAIVSWLITIFKSGKKDTKEETSTIVEIGVNLKFLTKQLQGVEDNLRRIEDKLDNTNGGLIRLEEKVSGALNRLETLEKRVEKLEKTNPTN